MEPAARLSVAEVGARHPDALWEALQSRASASHRPDATEMTRQENAKVRNERKREENGSMSPFKPNAPDCPFSSFVFSLFSRFRVLLSGRGPMPGGHDARVGKECRDLRFACRTSALSSRAPWRSAPIRLLLRRSAWSSMLASLRSFALRLRGLINHRLAWRRACPGSLSPLHRLEFGFGKGGVNTCRQIALRPRCDERCWARARSCREHLSNLE
jgi:hypothetical protein